MRRKRLGQICAAILTVVMVGFFAPATSSALTLTNTSFAVSDTTTGATNTTYNYGFKTTSAASLSQVNISVPPGTNATGTRYMSLSGSSGKNDAFTPDSAANSITGDIDIRVKASLASWTPGTEQTFVSKWSNSGNSYSYLFSLLSTGKLQFAWTQNGSSAGIVASTVATGLPSGTSWVRIAAATSTGSFNFYTSTDGVSWTQVGTQISQAATFIYDGNLPVVIGAQADGTRPTTGRIYYAEIRNGISGTIANKFDPADDSVGGTTWTSTSPSAENWTVERTTQTQLGSDASGSYLSLSGLTGNDASTPDSVANSITGDIDIRVKAALPSWTPSSEQSLVSKWAASDASYLVSIVAGGNIQFAWSQSGSSSNVVNAGVGTGFANNAVGWLRVTAVMNSGGNRTINFYTSSDGSTWTQIGTPGTGAASSIHDGALELKVGEQSSNTGTTTGKIYVAEVRNGINGPVANRFDAANSNGSSVWTSTSPQGETWRMNVTTSAATDIAADLSASSTTGVPSGGTAYYRMIDGIATYKFAATAISASTPCTVSLGGFTNLNSPGAYASNIVTYDNSSTPVPIDSATTNAVNFAPAINVIASATIDPTMTFTVSGHSGACGSVAQTGSATASSVSLGHVTASGSATAAQDVTLTSNAGGGVSLYTRYSGPLADGASHTIPDTPGDGTWVNAQAFPVTGTAAFGYRYGWMTAGQWIPLTTVNMNNKSSANPVTSDCIAFQAQTGATTPAGAYSTIVFYTAVPTF